MQQALEQGCAKQTPSASNFFPVRICCMFPISKCRRKSDLGLCTTSTIAKRMPGNFLSVRICCMFPISKCRRKFDLGLCTTSAIAKRMPRKRIPIKTCFAVKYFSFFNLVASVRGPYTPPSGFYRRLTILNIITRSISHFYSIKTENSNFPSCKFMMIVGSMFATCKTACQRKIYKLQIKSHTRSRQRKQECTFRAHARTHTHTNILTHMPDRKKILRHVQTAVLCTELRELYSGSRDKTDFHMRKYALQEEWSLSYARPEISDFPGDFTKRSTCTVMLGDSNGKAYQVAS